MARLNQWGFAGQLINGPNVLVRDVSGAFALPPLRGADFLTMGRTGRLFVPKIHDSRDIVLEVVIRNTPSGMAQVMLDRFAIWATTRTQSALVNYLDSGPRTGQAECIAWAPADTTPTHSGIIYSGKLTFHLADPWLYGPTVSASVTPNAGLAVGTPVFTNILGTRTYWSAAMSGVTSGQPLLIVHGTAGYTSVVTSITDTFSGHYTYTKVDGNNTNEDLEVWIGTGGTGTSGTVTVNAPNGLMGGMVIPFTGASTASGLAAIDTHVNGMAVVGSSLPPTITPTAIGELALCVSLGHYPYWMGWPSPFTGAQGLTYSSVQVELTSWVLYPTPGVGLSGIWGTSGPPGTGFECVGLVLVGSAAPVFLSITNSGTATAEKMVIDFLGPIINPTILNTTTGASVTINTTVASSTHLVVDTGAFTALNAGSSVIGSVFHSGAVPFLTLAPGPNVLQVSGSLCTGASLVTVSFAPPYE